jgi:fructose-1-phosphate kinase PfkB-like protein
VTRRTDDLVLVGEGNAWRLRSPSAFNVANSAGFADCLVAGIALGVEQGMRVVDATRFGLGATADNAATLLPARVDPARVSDLADAVEVEPWRPWHGSQPAEHAPTQN